MGQRNTTVINGIMLSKIRYLEISCAFVKY